MLQAKTIQTLLSGRDMFGLPHCSTHISWNHLNLEQNIHAYI